MRKSCAALLYISARCAVVVEHLKEASAIALGCEVEKSHWSKNCVCLQEVNRPQNSTTCNFTLLFGVPWPP